MQQCTRLGCARDRTSFGFSIPPIIIFCLLSSVILLLPNAASRGFLGRLSFDNFHRTWLPFGLPHPTLSLTSLSLNDLIPTSRLHHDTALFI
jgi:hypothetical protein